MLSFIKLSDINGSQISQVLTFGFDAFSFSSRRDQYIFTYCIIFFSITFMYLAVVNVNFIRNL